MKYLLLIVVVIVAILLLPRQRVRADKRTSRARQPGGPDVQEMVACAHCQVHLPSGDAVRDGAGRSFCSDAHRLAGPRGS